MELQTTTRRPRRQNTPHLSQKTLLILIVAVAIMLMISAVLLFTLTDNDLWDPVSDRQIRMALEANDELPEQTQIVIDSAVSLVGKVHYFWGGKSESVGWDDRWGKLTEVTSKGSSTTGTKRPFGLDCSGFVTWCFIQTGYDWEEAVNTVGNGTMNQWKYSDEIPWEELQPGDFAFQHEPGDPEGNHIGICIGYDKKGEPLFVHCAAGENNVVVTHADDVFIYARRPDVFQ